MTRFATLASTGLFAAGLAILPVSVFAQPSATVTAPAVSTQTTVKSANTQAAVKSDNKVTAPVVQKDAGPVLHKDASKTDAGKSAVTKPAPVNGQVNGQVHGQVNTPAKTATHG